MVWTIADLTCNLFTQKNQRMTTLAMFVDLRKVFNRVNLNILVKKLEKAGIAVVYTLPGKQMAENSGEWHHF